MAQASTPPTPATGPSPGRPSRKGISWTTGLLLGLCFGLGYGLTQRLLPLNPIDRFGGFQLFGVKPPPGTELDSLRKREGVGTGAVRADLDQLETERKQAEETKQEEEMARRREAMEKRERLEQESDPDSLTDSPAGEGNRIEVAPPESRPTNRPEPQASSRPPAAAAPRIPAPPALPDPPPLPAIPPVPPLPQP